MVNIVKPNYSGDLNTNILPSNKKKYMYDSLEKLKQEWDATQVVDIPEATKYDRKELINVDRVAVREDVKKSYADEFANKVLSLNTKANSDIENQKQKISGEKAKSQENEVLIKDSFENARTKSKDDMIKQGLARSSIAVNEEERIGEEEKFALYSAKSESERKIKGYELEIALLSNELKNDLSALQISHAEKVQKKIDDILSDIDKENAKILEYNNDMEKLEVRDAEKRAEIQHSVNTAKQKQAVNEAKYGYSGEKKENYLARYDIALDYFDSLPKKQAIKELTSDIKMTTYLGLYYDRLLSYLHGKED